MTDFMRNDNSKIAAILLTRRGMMLALAAGYVLLIGCGPLIAAFERTRGIPLLAWQQLGINGLIALFCVFFLLMLLGAHRFLFAVAMPVCCLLGALANFTALTLDLPITADSIGVVLEATLQEMRAFLNTSLALYLLAALCFSLAAVYWRIRERPDPSNPRVTFIAAAFVAGAVIGDPGGLTERFVPYNILKSTYRYGMNRVIPDAVINIAATPAQWRKKPDRLTLVIVLGESARGDHFGLNGYARNTTPKLAARKNLISFPDVISCTALTRTAIPCMLTRTTLADAAHSTLELTPRESSLIGLLRAQGFETLWLGTQGAHSFADAPFTRMMNEAHHTVLLNQYTAGAEIRDAEALPYIEQFLKGEAPYKLLIFHTMGSHWPYQARYPQEFERFTPVCAPPSAVERFVLLQSAMEECDRIPGALVNSYDNSILYTDSMLDQLLSRLEAENALVLYASDHGQSLGENGHYLHGDMTVPEQRHPAMLLWASPSFAAKHRDIVERWRQIRSHPVTHDAIFHSVIDCSGLDSPLVDRALSLCTPLN